MALKPHPLNLTKFEWPSNVGLRFSGHLIYKEGILLIALEVERKVSLQWHQINSKEAFWVVLGNFFSNKAKKKYRENHYQLAKFKQVRAKTYFIHRRMIIYKKLTTSFANSFQIKQILLQMLLQITI